MARRKGCLGSILGIFTPTGKRLAKRFGRFSKNSELLSKRRRR